jgi:hypothetical protein
MSVLSLEGNKHLAVAYTSPWLGNISYEVESDRPIAVLVLDEANLLAWRNQQNYVYLGGTAGAQVTAFTQTLFLPSNTKWFLVMVNYNYLPAAVWYRAR